MLETASEQNGAWDQAHLYSCPLPFPAIPETTAAQEVASLEKFNC